LDALLSDIPLLSPHDGTSLFTAGCTDNSADASAYDIPRRMGISSATLRSALLPLNP
jgi:hypothetical protein